MGPDPHVVGIIPGDHSQYGGPLYAIPDHDQGEFLRYACNDFWHFKYSSDEMDRFDSALEFLHDLSLTAEVTCFHKASCVTKQRFVAGLGLSHPGVKFLV